MYLFISEFVVGMVAGAALGISALVIIAVICARKADDEQGPEDR